MTKPREEVVKTLIRVFTVKVKKFDSHSYEYWDAASRWETLEQASAEYEILDYAAPDRKQIVRTSLDVMNTGRVDWHDNLVVLNENGEWAGAFDPRATDPEWVTFLRLKEKFNA